MASQVHDSASRGCDMPLPELAPEKQARYDDLARVAPETPPGAAEGGGHPEPGDIARPARRHWQERGRPSELRVRTGFHPRPRSDCGGGRPWRTQGKALQVPSHDGTKLLRCEIVVNS